MVLRVSLKEITDNMNLLLEMGEEDAQNISRENWIALSTKPGGAQLIADKITEFLQAIKLEPEILAEHTRIKAAFEDSIRERTKYPTMKKAGFLTFHADVDDDGEVAFYGTIPSPKEGWVPIYFSGTTTNTTTE